MYPWADYTWNPLAGRCPHDCSYCYMKLPPFSDPKYRGPQRVWKNEMKVNLSNLRLHRREPLEFAGEHPVIFVCSGNDLGAAPFQVQLEILDKCCKFPENFYLIQSKNPSGLKRDEGHFPPNVLIGTTVETNRSEVLSKISRAPEPRARLEALAGFDCPRMVSIEPIMDCNPEILSGWIQDAGVDFISIGADSKGHHLPEPTGEKIAELIERLKGFTKIKKKRNLRRLLGGIRK